MMRQLLSVTLLALLLTAATADFVTLPSGDAQEASSLEQTLGMTVPCYINNCNKCVFAFECLDCADEGNCCSLHCTSCNNNTCGQCAQGYNLKMGLCVPQDSCKDLLTACANCDATGLCTSCRDGFYLNEVANTCLTCPLECFKCED
jgi:hypothetical protein